jgi:gamma-glutamylcyclotransferase (GGCT)/AIG2-like uncharacterized protein YtfP
MDCFASLAMTYERHDIRQTLRLRHADARLRSSDGAAVVAQRGFYRRGAVRGRLYLVTHYPALVLSDDAAEIVSGELFRLRAPQELLREFDMYEACGEGFAEPTEYVRQMLSVTLGNETTEAWTYVYNWPVAHLTRITSGRFVER